MTWNERLARVLDDRIYTQGYESEGRELEHIVDQYIPGSRIVYINSNKARIHTIMDAVSNTHCIVWDEMYWQMYYQFLALISAPTDSPEALDDPYPALFSRFHELGMWVIGIFSDYLSRKYDRKYSLSDVFLADKITTQFHIWQKVFDYELRKEDRGAPLAIPFRYTKLYILHHEIAHILFQQNKKLRSHYETFILNNLPYLQKTRDEIEPLLEELLADAFALDRTRLHWEAVFGSGKRKLLQETYKAAHIFLHYFNLTNLYWDVYYTRYITEKETYEDEADAEQKKGIVNANYKETLSFPFISRKALVLSDAEKTRLENGSTYITTRHIDYSYLFLSCLAATLGGNDEESIPFAVNHAFYEDLNNKISNTLLDPVYISSRIMTAMKKKRQTDKSAHEQEKERGEIIRDGISLLGDDAVYDKYTKNFVCYLKIPEFNVQIRTGDVHALAKTHKALLGLAGMKNEYNNSQEVQFGLADPNNPGQMLQTVSFRMPSRMHVGMDYVIISYHHVEPQRDMLDLYKIMFDINLLLYRLLAGGVYVRGGFTYGDLYHKGELCYGPALLEAIELESNTRHPIVAIAPHIFDRHAERFPYKKVSVPENIYRSTFLLLRDEKAGCLREGEARTYMFDFLYQFLGDHMEQSRLIRNDILTQLREKEDTQNRQAFLWLKDYFNDTLSALGNDDIAPIEPHEYT